MFWSLNNVFSSKNILRSLRKCGNGWRTILKNIFFILMNNAVFGKNYAIIVIYVIYIYIIYIRLLYNILI